MGLVVSIFSHARILSKYNVRVFGCSFIFLVQGHRLLYDVWPVAGIVTGLLPD